MRVSLKKIVDVTLTVRHYCEEVTTVQRRSVARQLINYLAWPSDLGGGYQAGVWRKWLSSGCHVGVLVLERVALSCLVGLRRCFLPPTLRLPQMAPRTGGRRVVGVPNPLCQIDPQHCTCTTSSRHINRRPCSLLSPKSM
jgi:hypothetical protein